MVLSRLRDKSFEAGGNCHSPTVWPDSSVVRVLAWSAREIVTVLSCGPIAQWSEYLHGLRGVLGSSPIGSCAFSSPVT